MKALPILMETARMGTGNRLAIDSGATYEIRIQGYLDESWSNRMSGVAIRLYSQPDETPVTVLTGYFQDQAALAGALSLLYDLGFPLLLVECLAIQPEEGI